MKRSIFLTICGALLFLTACMTSSSPADAEAPCRREVMAMDTIMTLTVYPQTTSQGEEILQKAVSQIQELEDLLSVTAENSEIYRANHSQGVPVELSAPVRELLAEALALCASTRGALDVSVYPIVRTWGFTTGEYRVPEQAEIDRLLPQVDYTKVLLDGSSLTLPPGMELDLGAVAKGYTGDRLMELFTAEGVTSAIIELGGNVQTLGSKPDGTPWRVGLQAPEGGYAGELEIIDKAVVTSGGYQRYFEADGKTYIHIIDPATGYPADSGLISVTIVADSGILGDGLSTALFVMGREKAEEYWRAHPDFDFVLLTEEGTVVITDGLADTFRLYGAWEGKPLEVVRRERK